MGAAAADDEEDEEEEEDMVASCCGACARDEVELELHCEDERLRTDGAPPEEEEDDDDDEVKAEAEVVDRSEFEEGTALARAPFGPNDEGRDFRGTKGI